LTIIALLSAKKSPKLSACTLGLACLLRYTAWLAVPFALWESRQRWKYFALFALVTLPHWGMVIFSGGEFWNQGENALLGMNISYFHKFWEGLFFVGNPILLASFLCWGGRYRSLLLYGLLHFVIICYFFPNPRLLLPTSLVLAFCAGLVVEKNNKGWIWAVVVLSALLIHRNPTDRVWKERAQLAEKIEMVEGAFFSIAPHVYSIQEDKYVGATPLQILGDPQKMTYSLVLAQGQKRGVKWLVFPNQIRMAYPLLDLSSMTPVWSGSRWRVYKLDAD
jgi:hypothetical protein